VDCRIPQKFFKSKKSPEKQKFLKNSKNSEIMAPDTVFRLLDKNSGGTCTVSRGEIMAQYQIFIPPQIKTFSELEYYNGSESSIHPHYAKIFAPLAHLTWGDNGSKYNLQAIPTNIF
jgi:hypothetical protein